MTARSPGAAPAQAPYTDDHEHLADELRWLDLVIRRRAARFRAALRAMEPTITGQQMYISHAEVDRLLLGEAAPEGEAAGTDTDVIATRAQIDDRIAHTLEHGVVPALVQLARMFQLTPFEQRALTVCLAPELDTKYDKIYAYLHDDVTRKRPSVRLILDLLCPTAPERWHARAALTDRGALLYMGLLQVWDDTANLSGNGDLARFLRLDPAILNFLLGVNAVDARLEASFSMLPAASRGDDRAQTQIERRLHALIEGYVDAQSTDAGRLVINLHGARGVGRRDLARAACRRFGWPLACIDLEQLLDGQTDLDGQLRLALRQSLLWQVPVYLENLDVVLERDALAARIARHVGQFCRLVFVASTRPWNATQWFDSIGFHHFQVPFPDTGHRERAWRDALATLDSADAQWSRRLARQYRLTSRQITDAVNSARHERTMSGGAVALDDLYTACRRQSHHALGELAAHIEPSYRWAHLVLPEEKLQHLRELCAQVRYRFRVFDEWGFGERLSHGKGLSALFAGPPGTGKTMAAEVIAHELGLDLYKVDLSGVVSKYIGETEKNLAKIFKEAESSNAILFFDEADALFGKRTDVASAHDRYANIETSYLLQKMEDYEGVVILASNLRENMDEAFVRRLRFIIDFPFPDEANRLRIWQTHFPPQAPVAADVDHALLARQLPVAGGNIKNIVLNAAFLAAADGGAISMMHLLDSARREYEKIGKRWDEVQIAAQATAAA